MTSYLFYLRPGSAALWEGNHPDVGVPDVEVVDPVQVVEVALGHHATPRLMKEKKSDLLRSESFNFTLPVQQRETSMEYKYSYPFVFHSNFLIHTRVSH